MRSTLLAASYLALAQQGSTMPTKTKGMDMGMGMGSGCQAMAPSGKAAYFITNEDANSVVALSIDANGMIMGGTSMQTGGAGSATIDGKTMAPALSDPLVSQAALTVAGRNLFAVNAGSNTVTMFMIDEMDPTKLMMVGQPVQVPGEFPNTVAASAMNGIVCVGTTGAVAGVSCAPFTEEGIGAMDSIRPFDLKQTTPPVGPLNTVSQTFFSEDQSTLFVTVKGDPSMNNTGFLASFPMQASCNGMMMVSSEGTRSSPSGTAVLFGSAPVPGSTDLFVTDASFGAAVLSLDQVSTASVKGRGAIDGQAATCWAAISPVTKTAFVTDVAVNRLVEMSLEDASVISEIDLTANGQPGMIDLRAIGSMVYALSPGNGQTEPAIVVVDAKAKKQVQFFGLASLGVSNRAQGLAVIE